uniref:Uncharacterized protein n=1 Tax=Strigamia maritima TaxID=126957 RepID=T1IN39_STRMM
MDMMCKTLVLFTFLFMWGEIISSMTIQIERNIEKGSTDVPPPETGDKPDVKTPLIEKREAVNSTSDKPQLEIEILENRNETKTYRIDNSTRTSTD